MVDLFGLLIVWFLSSGGCSSILLAEWIVVFCYRSGLVDQLFFALGFMWLRLFVGPFLCPVLFLRVHVCRSCVLSIGFFFSISLSCSDSVGNSILSPAPLVGRGFRG